MPTGPFGSSLAAGLAGCVLGEGLPAGAAVELQAASVGATRAAKTSPSTRERGRWVATGLFMCARRARPSAGSAVAPQRQAMAGLDMRRYASGPSAGIDLGRLPPNLCRAI